MKVIGESKRPVYLNCLWNYSLTYKYDVRSCTSKWTLANIQKEKGDITFRLQFHYLIRFIPMTFLRQYSSYFSCQTNWMSNTLRQIVVAMLFHCLYTWVYWVELWADPIFFKQRGECCYFLKWFFLWVNQAFKMFV